MPSPRSPTDCIKDQKAEKLAKLQQRSIESWIDIYIPMPWTYFSTGTILTHYETPVNIYEL
jgi:hypothetical protein